MKVRKPFVVWVLVLGLCNLVLPTSVHSALHQSSTPVASAEAIPATPVGDQLTWVLSQLNGDASTLTEAEIEAHFAPAFLASFPFPLLDLLRETATEYAPVTSTGFPFPPTATGAVLEVDLSSGEHAAIYLVVEEAAPHRITRLDLNEAPATGTTTGRRVSIGERQLYLDCQGSGSPTVLLEGGITADWQAVQTEVSGFTRVCSYDRPDSPGSRSDPTATRTAQEVVDDLHALMAAAGETDPYVLVGHSMGGLYVQLYAYRHPTAVAGLVLVDPTHEEFSARLGALVEELGTPMPPPSDTLSPEEVDFAQMREARASGSLPSVPLVVLSHGRDGDPAERPPGWPIEEEERIWRALHMDLANSVPEGEHIVAENSGHNIHQDEPQVVATAVRDVVNIARPPGGTATPAGE